MIDELNIQLKEDHPDKAAAVEGIETKYYTTAGEFNNIVAKVNEVSDVVNDVAETVGQLEQAVSDLEVYAHKSLTYCFTTPANVIKDYFPVITSIQAIVSSGVATLSYSVNGGTTYTAIALPLVAPLSLPVGWILFKITYTPGVVTGAVNLTI